MVNFKSDKNRDLQCGRSGIHSHVLATLSCDLQVQMWRVARSTLSQLKCYIIPAEKDKLKVYILRNPCTNVIFKKEKEGS